MIKSGTNSLRGTAYLAKTPGALFANDFFANANNIPLAEFNYNRYGGMAGGPIRKPARPSSCTASKASTRARPRNNGTPTVPTEKMRNGDFSGAAGARAAVSDLQPLHAPVDRRRAVPAGSVPGQHHSGRT